jgi:hypothetical protein
MIVSTDIRAVVAVNPQLVRWLEVERLTVKFAARLSVAARDVFHATFSQIISFFRLRASDKSLTNESCNLI